MLNRSFKFDNFSLGPMIKHFIGEKTEVHVFIRGAAPCAKTRSCVSKKTNYLKFLVLRPEYSWINK